MNLLSESKYLKTILHSKRANIYYLEHCRVLVNGGRVEYLTQDTEKQAYWNIPIANTTVILLGTGTSITQAAVRLLATAGVMIGFCGGGATPLLAGTAVEWLSPQSEYRPTEYLQAWLSFWFDPEMRLKAAKRLQQNRLDYLRKVWEKDKGLQDAGFFSDDKDIEITLAQVESGLRSAASPQQLLEQEARAAKKFYAYAAGITKYGAFSRDHDGGDDANAFNQ